MRGCSVRRVPMAWGGGGKWWWHSAQISVVAGREGHLWRSVARLLRAQVCLASQAATDGAICSLPCVKTGGNAAQIALGAGVSGVMNVGEGMIWVMMVCV